VDTSEEHMKNKNSGEDAEHHRAKVKGRISNAV